MYYLQSRYYDAEVGRFVGEDASEYIIRSKATQDYNLYSYCNNEPISNSDILGNRKWPKLVATGIQVECGIACFSYGFEIIFANSNAYLFTYNGLSYGTELNKILGLIRSYFTLMFTKNNFGKYIRKIFDSYVSICAFAIFNTAGSSFFVGEYTEHFVGAAFTVPTIYRLLGKPIGVKTYVSSWSNLISVGIGFVWPSSLEMSATYSYYTYRGCVSLPNQIKNLVNKETKGLKP